MEAKLSGQAPGAEWRLPSSVPRAVEVILLKDLTVTDIKLEASIFLRALSQRDIASLFGATDGKAVGTFVEHAFHAHLERDYDYVLGSSARGIDFPELGLDIKVTSTRQPQSSCPYSSASNALQWRLQYARIISVADQVDGVDSLL